MDRWWIFLFLEFRVQLIKGLVLKKKVRSRLALPQAEKNRSQSAGFRLRHWYSCSAPPRVLSLSLSWRRLGGRRRRPTPPSGLRRRQTPPPGASTPSHPFLFCETEHPNPNFYIYSDIRIWSNSKWIHVLCQLNFDFFFVAKMVGCTCVNPCPFTATAPTWFQTVGLEQACGWMVAL